MSVLSVGGQRVSSDEALSHVVAYAQTYPDTLRVYDGVTQTDSTDDDTSEVTLADIGRLVVINANLKAGDVPRLLDVDATAEFNALDPQSRLEDHGPGTDQWEAAGRLYERFRGRALMGIGGAKRSKLLHIKRPRFVPIWDSHIERVYSQAARDAAATRADGSRGYWEAIRGDLISGEEVFDGMRSELAAAPDSSVSRAAQLTNLRLLDVIAWRLGRPA